LLSYIYDIRDVVEHQEQTKKAVWKQLHTEVNGIKAKKKGAEAPFSYYLSILN
jgi:hypothetical protein